MVDVTVEIVVVHRSGFTLEIVFVKVMAVYGGVVMIPVVAAGGREWKRGETWESFCGPTRKKKQMRSKWSYVV